MALRESEIEPCLRIFWLLRDDGLQLFFRLLVLLLLQQRFGFFERIGSAIVFSSRLRMSFVRWSSLRERRQSEACQQRNRDGFSDAHWIQSSHSLRCAPATFRCGNSWILPLFPVCPPQQSALHGLRLPGRDR